MDRLRSQAKKIIEIRTFEECILKLFSENKLSGTTHTYIGEEATAVAVMEYLYEDDKVFSNHRCHGHYLAYGGPKNQLLAEIMSKESGLCQGRGGSQHIHYKNFYSNGIQGGIVPNALGMSWADKLMRNDSVTVVFLGDGTLGQGIVYESFNLASMLECPILFVVEDNSYAMSTKSEYAVRGNIIQRSLAFGIQSDEIESTDVEELDAAFAKAFSYIRKNRKPFCQIVHNYRLAAHSKGDDYRDENEVLIHKQMDPVSILEKKLGKSFIDTLKLEQNRELTLLVEAIEAESCICISDYSMLFKNNPKGMFDEKQFFSGSNERTLIAINHAIRSLLEARTDLIVFGEDICDPYGGAFKVTKGLSTDYPNRVINMPISEAAMAGMAVGLAMNHMVPMVELMFGDFVTLCFDQLLNHAAKYAWVYGNGVSVPMVLRIPSGGGRGYGPTHSQSLEKYLLGIPEIYVVAITNVLNVEKHYSYIVNNTDRPLVIIENKKMYAERAWEYVDGRIGGFSADIICNDFSPSVRLTLDPPSAPDVIIVTYGGMVGKAMEAAKILMIEDEIQVNIIVITQLAPLPVIDIQTYINCKRIVTLEEGNKSAGFGSEVISYLAENMKETSVFVKIASPDIPIPNGVALENQIVPGREMIVNEIKKIVR